MNITFAPFLSTIYTLVGLLFPITSIPALADATDWSQPPALCVEDLKPSILRYAETAKINLAASKFDHSTDDYNYALIDILATRDLDEKIDRIYLAANKVGMPPQILMGAMMQESGLADQGIEIDGGGYSCGISAIQISEWCQWGRTLSKSEAKKVQFPSGSLEKFEKWNHRNVCETELADSLVTKLFFDRTWDKFKDRPDLAPHRVPAFLSAEYSSFASIKDILPGTTQFNKKLSYDLAQSFLKNCGDHRFAIFAMAGLLKYNYEHFVPEGLRQAEHYRTGEGYRRTCTHKVSTTAYPFNTGWLLAVAIDNAGEAIVPAIEKYRKKSWDQFTPEDLDKTLELIPTTGDLFGKLPGDWAVVKGHIRSVVGHLNSSSELILGRNP